jgi:cell wall-associated NlpC family hydrolase
MIGIKYKDFGRDEKGLDCFGAVIYYYKNFLNKNVEDYFYDDIKNIGLEQIKKMQKQWYLVQKLEKNDIILIDSIFSETHVLIYIGNNKVLHSSMKNGVCIENLQKFKTKIKSIYRFRG